MKKASLLWVDPEMTGLDPKEDAILEVAAIATNYDFKPIATYEGIVKVDEKELANLLKKNGDFWNANPKARDGLIKQNASGKGLQEIEDDLLKFVEENFNLNKPIYLAGNSVHMDQKFIEVNWKRLTKKLHYRILDVSAWKIIFENKYKKRFAKPEDHRALNDIQGSIEELRYYLKYVGNQNK